MPLSDSNNISIEFYEKSVKRNRIYNKVKPSEDDDNPQEFTINIFNYMPSKLDKGDLDTIFKSITSFIQTGDKYVDPFAGTPKEAISSAKLSKFEHTQIDKYSNKLLNDMRYNEKRSLYESIMKDVAKVVKRHLNEDSTKQNNIKYNGFNELRYYSRKILDKVWAIANNEPDYDVDPIVNDNNLYIFVIKEEDYIEFVNTLLKEIKVRELNVKNLSNPITKSSLSETDLFIGFNQTNKPELTSKAMHTMMAIADGQIQNIKLDKKPYILYVTPDESILNINPLMHRASKVFVQRLTLDDEWEMKKL